MTELAWRWLALTIEWHGRGFCNDVEDGHEWVGLIIVFIMQAFGQCISDVYVFMCLFGVWAWVSVR